MDLRTQLKGTLDRRRGTGEFKWEYNVSQLDHEECDVLLERFDEAIEILGVPRFLDDGFDIDTPIPFDADNLVELLPLIAADTDSEAVNWVAPMVERLRGSMADQRNDQFAHGSLTRPCTSG